MLRHLVLISQSHTALLYTYSLQSKTMSAEGLWDLWKATDSDNITHLPHLSSLELLDMGELLCVAHHLATLHLDNALEVKVQGRQGHREHEWI